MKRARKKAQSTKTNVNEKKTNIPLLIGVIVVVVLAIVYLQNLDRSNEVGEPVTNTGEELVVSMAVDGPEYIPSTITVEKGRPTKLVVDGDRALGCMRYLVIKEAGIDAELEKGENIFQFTPKRNGEFRITCSMGMGEGILKVVDKVETEVQEPSDDVEMMSDNMHVGMMKKATFLPGDEQDLDNIAEVQSSTIVPLNDGDTFKLTADFVEKEIAGKKHVMYGYNGMIPGPALRVKQGSTVFIDFENNIDMETTVHWHGLRHDIMNDGVPGVSQDPVKPGESFRYELFFPDGGIFWYHPHIREDVQQDAGLAGNMLVTPDIAYNPVNREELLMLDDILLDSKGNIVPFGGEHANFAIMGRFGNTMLINGDTTYNLDIDKGEVVRFYITNVANVRPFNLTVEGAQMKLVGGDLGEFEHEEFVDSVVIAPAVRFFVDVYFEESGAYNLLNSNPHEKYTLGTVSVSDTEVAESHLTNFLNARTNDYVIEDIARFEPHFDKEPDYSLDLTIDMGGMMDSMAHMPCHVMAGVVMGDCTEEERIELEEELEEEHGEMTIEWEDEMNMRASASMVKWIIEDVDSSKQNMDIEMQAKVGDVVKIRLFNDPESMHPMQHPIHLHGQRFIATAVDGEPVTNKVWTDTILVPIGSTVDILVDVTNPGEWMMHCHIAEHLEAGMMTSFNVEE